jgi:hypothetical protein
MELGYLAIDERTGQQLNLSSPNSPRKQLLEKLGASSASKIYCDTKDGKTRHTGYIVRGGWWRIYKVCEWNDAV